MIEVINDSATILTRHCNKTIIKGWSIDPSTNMVTQALQFGPADSREYKTSSIQEETKLETTQYREDDSSKAATPWARVSILPIAAVVELQQGRSNDLGWCVDHSNL